MRAKGESDGLAGKNCSPPSKACRIQPDDGYARCPLEHLHARDRGNAGPSAIFEAAADCTLRGIVVKPEVMIPLTGTVKELEWIQPRLERIAAHGHGRKERQIRIQIRHDDRIPRAAVTAGEVAERAQFFSFGTNDLTQMTYGYSRDDAERNFLITYQEQGILETNPFQSLDARRGQAHGMGNF